MEELYFEPTARANGLSVEIDRNQFALALKTWRIRQGRTQKDVAHEWGVSRFSLIKAETGKPISWAMAYRLFARLSEELKKEGGKI